MPTWGWVVIGIGAAIVCAAIAWSAYRNRRQARLRETFGPEYDRKVADAPTRREAEAELTERKKRREDYEIRSLEPEARERYLQQWRQTQERFVDDPEAVVSDADRLIRQVMRERGYPVEDFEQRAADLSVDHPDVISNYRAAHGITTASRRGDATTEDLRNAVVHYRALFSELLETDAVTTQQR